MNRVRQNGVWLSPEENKKFMAKRFKEEHGIDINAEKEVVEPIIEQELTEVPVVEESTNGSETPKKEESETPEELVEEVEPGETAKLIKKIKKPKAKRGRPAKKK